MKKVTMGGNNTNLNSLTELVAKLQKMNYVQDARIAQSHGGDTVFTIYNQETKFFLEYCVKERKVDGKKFVNWARVHGEDELVDKFLRAVGHIDYKEVNINKVVIPQL